MKYDRHSVRHNLKVLERERKKENRFNPIYKKKKNGQWGYYINEYFEDVINYMKENKLNSLIDLGAGEGHVVELLNDIGFQAKGYEIEDQLIESYHKIFNRNNIEKKDIMLLTTDDIKEFDVIYFYEPFREGELKKQFLNHIFNILQPNQTILYKHEKDNYMHKNIFYIEEYINKKPFFYGSLEVLKK